MTNLPPGMEVTRHRVLDAESHAFWCELGDDQVVIGEFICRERTTSHWDRDLCAQPLDPGATFCPGCGATRWDISLPGDAMLTGWAPGERECICDG